MLIKIEHNTIPGSAQELFTTSFNQTRDKKEWLWKYKESPQGFTTARAYDGDKLICQYGGIQYSCFMANKEYKIFQMIDVMTHPKYRDGWTIAKTAQKFFEYYTTISNPLFLYGFTAGVSREFHIKKLGYYAKTPVGYIRKKISSQKRLSLKNSPFKVKPVSSFDHKVDELYKEFLESYSLVLKKDKKYLDWRYINTPIGYKLFSLNLKEEDKLVGYIIIKEEKNKICLVDFLLDRRILDKLTIFLSIFEKEYLNPKVFKTFEAWSPKSSPYYQELLKFGFKPYPEPRNLYFTVRPFSKIASNIFTDSNFSYTMGDSDLF